MVLPSFGHVRDLPKSTLGVDVERGFKPKYTIPAKAKPVIKELKEAASKSGSVILATDEDREGEAIAWHLTEALGLNTKKVERIVFHEITKSAIEDALKHPRGLDYNLVDAQQARRVLDRLVGYELSPFLWKKIKPGLSAGRVQSVALRLVVEREREIQSFVKQEYWSIEADFKNTEENSRSAEKNMDFRARLIKIGEKTLEKLDIKNKNEAEKIVKNLDGAEYRVADISKKEITRSPAPPFTTSTLQQEASRKLGWSAKQTMITAQRLYETGFITYMRTDSVNLADSALSQAAEVIEKNFGHDYVQIRKYMTKTKGAQEAHEAIRPTNLSLKPDQLGSGFDRGQARLYELIWKRTLASQMKPALFDQTSADISAEKPGDGNRNPKFIFRASGQVMKFDGFIRVYMEGRDDEDEEEKKGRLPELSVGEKLRLLKLLPLQHFTEPPPRYTDATLVKALEANGIGRPSTYAPILATIQERDYVEKVDRRYYKPTEVGFLVNDMLVENFPEIVDINFTSHIEEELDEIAEGKRQWVPVIEEFYAPFKKHLEEKVKSVERHTEMSDTPCPHCGKMMVVKFGRTGKYLACPEPGSKIYQPMPEETAQIKELEEKTKDERCPICGKEMKVKRGRFGYFLSCIDYPICKGVAKILNKTGFKCPNCGSGDIVERKSRGRGRIFYACSRFPECKFLIGKKPMSESDIRNAYEEWKKNPPKLKKTKKSDKMQ